MTAATTTRPATLLFGRPVDAIHCLGVGGMGMAPLALALAQQGLRVTGEDDGLAPDVAALLAAGGVLVRSLPESCDGVVHSSAVRPDHPSYRRAAARGLPLARRGAVLAEFARSRRLVAVCGSHGKTTTTAMLATAVAAADFPAGWIGGGLPSDGSAPARVGEQSWLVAEIDESDGTIDLFEPEITVAVNLDWDHPDRYPSVQASEAAFAGLFRRTRGTVLVNAACGSSRRLAPAGAATFGPEGDFRGAALGETEEGILLALGGRFGSLASPVRVRARGAFNALNATAALAAFQLMSGERPRADLLASFAGVKRRQSLLGVVGGVTVIEDYAHHPGEIGALLPSLRARLAPGGRLIVAFQPHRYSRTARFRTEFAQALGRADRVHLVDTYGAGEQPLDGGTTADLFAELVRLRPDLPAFYRRADPDRRGLVGALAAEAGAGDCLAFVGAGDIDRTAREALAALTCACAAAGGAPAGAAAAAAAGRDPLGGGRDWDKLAEQWRPRLCAGARLVREEPLARRTTMRVGGAARLYAEPACLDDLRVLLSAARRAGVRVLMLGRGSNLVVPDRGVDGLVVSLGHEAWSRFEALADGRVRVGAGLRLKNLCGLAAAAGLGGFEFLEGIPGSLGGALRMNAGAMGGWIFDVVDELTLMAEGGEIAVLPRSALRAEYRSCVDLESAVALEAILRPAGPTGAAAVNAVIEGYRAKRHASQPREPSAGCIFKNPPGTSAGRLIDASGLKGLRVGDAEVSPVHANFIVNRGAATAADVVGLVRLVRSRVRASQGVDLEPEVILFGTTWDEVLREPAD